MKVREELVSEITAIVTLSQEKAIRSVDTERVLMYWNIGSKIFEEEKQGKKRADYGKYLIKFLSERLQPQFGSGYSVRQLELFRQFYRCFPIANALRSQFSWTTSTIACDSSNKYLEIVEFRIFIALQKFIT
jgi:DUF1016 N-terminal domain